jgi:hypothetical protein
VHKRRLSPPPMSLYRGKNAKTCRILARDDMFLPQFKCFLPKIRYFYVWRPKKGKKHVFFKKISKTCCTWISAPPPICAPMRGGGLLRPHICATTLVHPIFALYNCATTFAHRTCASFSVF